MNTYTCNSCNSSFSSAVMPRQCNRCGSRLLRVASTPTMMMGMSPRPAFAGARAYNTPAYGTPAYGTAGYAPGNLAAGAPATAAQVPGSGRVAWKLALWGIYGSVSAFLLAMILAPIGEQSYPVYDYYGRLSYYRFEQTLAVPIGLLVLLSFAAAIVGAVGWVMFLYNGWKAVQPLRDLDPSQQNMPTPGKAIGFLFIPFFNLYWLFVAVPGLVKRANRLAADRAVAQRPASEAKALAWAILVLVFWPAALVLLPFVMADIRRLTEALRQ